MRFSAITFLLAALLLDLTSACLIIQGSAKPDQTITVNLFDNDRWVCTWSGKYTSGEHTFMICIPEFASWIRITNRRFTGPIVVIAYARYSANYTLQPVPSRFDCSQRSDTCELQSFGGRYFDDCFAAQTIEESKPGVEPAPPVGKLGDIVGTVGWVQGAQASTTADVTVTGGWTAGVEKATVF